MNASRLVAWIAGVALLGAWFASAAGVPRTAGVSRAPQRAPGAAALDQLAADVQAQAGRLRTRLASAPAPQAAIRNPFMLSAPAPAPIVRRSASRVSAPIAIDLPTFMAPEPALELIGIAENQASRGMVRTAMISSPQGDLLMVTAGQRILGTYDVVGVGADAVELKQVSTGAVRRLALR